MRPVRKLILSLWASFFVLAIFPALFSYSLLSYHISQSQLCFVTMPPPTSFIYLRSALKSDMKDCSMNVKGNITREDHCIDETLTNEFKEAHVFGIYAPHGNKAFHQVSSYEYQNPSQLMITRLFLRKNPSSTSIATSLQTPFRLSRDRNPSSLQEFYHDVDIDRWCFEYQLTSIRKVCTEHVMNNSSMYEGAVYLFSADDTHSTVYIQCPTALFQERTTHSSHLWNIFHPSDLIGTTGIQRNPNPTQAKESAPNELFQMITQHPTTTLLLITNVSLALIYYCKGIHPDVSCSFASIIHQREYWRCWSGSLAHFDPWHLFFNMSSLYALGTNLESMDGFSSIPFLSISICLMFWTPMVEMALIYLRIRWIQTYNQDASDFVSQLQSQKSIGFSGVLFAWMVLDSLDRDKTCPVPFFPDTCFSTQNLAGGWFKFNAGPFVSLVVCQFLIPRASFMGHLSGILCGFMLHWKVLPVNIAWSPEVLIPLFLLLDYWCLRNLVSFRLGLRCDSSDRSLWAMDTYNFNHDDDIIRIQQLALRYCCIIMVVLCCSSVMCYSILGTICLSQCLVTILFYMVTDAHRKIYTFPSSSIKLAAETIYQGLVVSLILSIVFIALAIGSAIGAWTHFTSEYSTFFGPVASMLVLTSLLLLHFVALILVSGIFNDMFIRNSVPFLYVWGWFSKNAHDTLALIFDKALHQDVSLHRR